MEMAQLKIFKVSPATNGLLLKAEVLASGQPVDIKPINNNYTSGIVIDHGPTVTGNIKDGTIVYYPAAAGCPFIDVPNSAEVTIIKETDVIGIKQQVINIDPRNLGAINPDMAKPRSQYQ